MKFVPVITRILACLVCIGCNHSIDSAPSKFVRALGGDLDLADSLQESMLERNAPCGLLCMDSIQMLIDVLEEGRYREIKTDSKMVRLETIRRVFRGMDTMRMEVNERKSVAYELKKTAKFCDSMSFRMDSVSMRQKLVE